MMPLPVSDVIAALPLPALSISADEQILCLNASAQKLLGIPFQERGHFMTVLRQPSIVEAVERCLAGTKQTSATYLAREGGTEGTYSVTVNLVGDTGVALVVFQDVTMVTAANQMRRDFVANVSHELRTPLTAMMGFIETLQGPARDDGPARDRFLGIMQTEAERMNRLVGDLLSLSRVEAKERIRPTTQGDVTAGLASTLETLSPVAVAKNVTLVVDLPKEPVLMSADIDQLQQVFTNLIENAIKYGGEGKSVFVTLTVHDRVRELRSQGVMLSVRDQGDGIDGRHLPRLTERFYRVDSHRNRAVGGTGLGLAIVKHILNRHQGRLKVTSKVGEGTDFRVLIPMIQS